MSNQLAAMPLYLLCQSLVSQNSPAINLNVVIQTPQVLPKLARELPFGYTIFPDIGVAYKVYRQAMTWSNGHKYCTGEGGDLALLDSFQKINYTFSLIASEIAFISVGIHRLFDENEWVEIKTGLPPAKIPWIQNPETEKKSRKCTRTDGSGVYASDCAVSTYFVCEISI